MQMNVRIKLVAKAKRNLKWESLREGRRGDLVSKDDTQQTLQDMTCQTSVDKLFSVYIS